MKKIYFLFFCTLSLIIPFYNFAQKANINKWSLSPFEHKVFVQNINQFDKEKSLGEDFKYIANPNGVDLFFTNTGLTYRYRSAPKMSEQEKEQWEKLGQIEMAEKLKPEIHFFKIEWINSNPNPEIIADDKQSFYYTYADPSDLNKSIKADCYKKITYKEIYPNIDAEFTLPEKGGMKYSFIVHPGGDINKIKYQYSGSKLTTVDAFGNIHIESEFGEFIEYAPLSFLSNTKSEIKSSFKYENNIVSFTVDSYDITEDLTIDPWINNPAFATNNQAYDVTFDMQGNVYAHGSIFPYKVVKYNAAGQLLWLYNTSGSFGTCGGGGNNYGDFAVDQVSQSVYIGEGFCQSRVIKLNKQGTAIGTYPGTCQPNMNEMWRLDYNRCVNKVVIGGGGTGTTRNQFALLDTTLSAVTPYNPLNANEALHDVSLLAFDPIGNFFYGATVRSTNYPQNYDNLLLKMSSNTIIPTLFSVYNTYTFQEGLTQSGFTWQNGQFACGFNGLACGQQYVYLYDGNKLQQRSKTNGVLVNQVLTSGVAMGCAGIAVDPCENIYVAANGSIEVYDASLNLIHTYNTNNAVYDLKLGPGGILYFCGEGQVGTISVTNSAPIITATSTPNTSCATSLCNGTATVHISCGNPSNYTFTWSGGQTTQTVSGLCSGTYTVVVTTACIFIDTLIINVAFNPTYPVINSTSGPLALNCAITSGTISVNATPSSVTYTWSGPGIVSGGNTSSPIVNAAGTYTVIVTIPGTGCTSSATVNVTQDITIPDLTANPGFMITCTNPSGSISANSNTPGVTYSWSGPGIVSGGNTNNPVVNGPGTYTVTVTNPTNFCTKTATVLVTSDNSIPNLSTGSPLTLNCLILSGTISASSTTAGVSYSWTGPGIVSGASTTTATVNLPGTYTVVVTDPGSGCTTVGAVQVTLDNDPPNIVTTTSPILTCVNTSDTVSITSSTTGVTYSWTGTGIVSGATTSTIIVNAPGTYTVVVTNPGNGCTNTAVVTVGINTTPPNVTAGSPLTLTCVVTSGTINAISTTSNVAYNWSGPGIVSGGNTSSPVVNLPGTYSVIVTDPVNGCTSTTSVLVNQNITIPNVSAGGTVILTCSSTNDTIYATSTTSGVYYNWSGPGIFAGGNTSSPIINATGTYTVTVTDPVNGCTNTATVTVISNVVSPTVVAGTAGLLTCIITSTTISASSPTPGATYSWSGPGVVSGGTTASPTVNQSGVYIVTVTDPATGCTNTTSVLVTDAPLPTATAANNTTIILGNNTQLIATGGGTYSWSPTTGLSCTTCYNPIASPVVNTEYCVTVTDQYGCTDSACVKINVFDPCPPSLEEFPMPNVFSPNGDGKNDLYFLKGWNDECIEEFSVEVYDRWGLKMFESIGTNVHWDGRTSSGLISPAGTYYYIVKVKKVRAEPEVYKGFLTLVR